MRAGKTGPHAATRHGRAGASLEYRSSAHRPTPTVIPAKAGIQTSEARYWIAAFAAMTEMERMKATRTLSKKEWPALGAWAIQAHLA